ncbi:hypothetical protein ACW910_22310 (plasmid) [Burkholderia ambifaria]
MVDVHVTLRIALKRAGGRGRARVLEREREMLAGVARAPTRDSVTVLQVVFDDDAFDRRVDDLLVAIALTAEQHRCTSESEVRAEVAGTRLYW